jgi:hypothetical protein
VRIGLVLIAFATYVGCDKVDFSTAPFEPRPFEDGTICTQSADSLEVVSCSGTKKAGMVDILFVDDNSGSMYKEQTSMATKFPTFIDSIKNLDYHISIITTDVSASKDNPPDEANNFGALQDGQFIPFPNGSKVISNATTDPNGQFQVTIQRDETKKCDGSYPICPSGDERGIYAVNLALDRADTTFFRGDSHLAIVILSDEDERSNGGNFSEKPLEDYDKPHTLVQKLGSVFGNDKTMSVHGVVIRPGDTACFDKQNAQTGVKGFYANVYKELTDPSPSLKNAGNIVKGHLGSICSEDYGVELGDIASKLQDNVNRIQLQCFPMDGTLSISYSPTPKNKISLEINSENQLVLNPPAPAGTEVAYSYDCQRDMVN